jgi:hypothetical protein
VDVSHECTYYFVAGKHIFIYTYLSTANRTLLKHSKPGIFLKILKGNMD